VTSTRYAAALLWLALVLFLGSAYFAAQTTGPFIVPILQMLAPGASSAELHAAHLALRKLAHLTEYAVLALLWFRALRHGGPRTSRAAAWIALSICLTCALIDEAHQSMIPTRTGSARDLVIDASGAAGMLALTRGRRTTRNRATQPGPVAAEPGD